MPCKMATHGICGNIASDSLAAKIVSRGVSFDMHDVRISNCIVITVEIFVLKLIS